MSVPKNITQNRVSKYEDVPFGSLQESLDKTGERIAKGKDKAKKALLDLCEIITVDIDPELGEIVVHYRFADVPKSPQSDESETQLIIECVTCDGEEITLNDWQYQAVVEIINNKK